MLDKVAGVLKKKRKNQRNTLLRVALVRFPLFFTVLPLWLCPSLLLLRSRLSVSFSSVSHAFTGLCFTF